MIRNCNDGSQSAPYLRLDLNYWNIHDLPDFSKGPKDGSEEERYLKIKEAGFVGVQDGDPGICEKVGLKLTGQFRMNKVGDLDEKIKEWTNGPYDCATIHAGWGIESEAEADRIIGNVIETSTKHDFPIYVETHRATLTQDMWRTVELIKRFPELRFNGDFSHWYTGLEMVNGDLEDKFRFMQPVFDRVRFIHARIGNPGSIQVDFGDNSDEPFVQHFCEMWTRSFTAFLKTAQPGDYLCFTPELLPSEYYYARKVKVGNEWVEEGDRWTQALLYCRLAKQCWETAKESKS